MSNVVSTKRSGILHLQNMKDTDFISFVKEIKTVMGGKLSGLKVNLKVDGAGARFGKDSSGRPFFEGSRTGPIFEPNSFSAHARSKGSDVEVLTRAGHYDDLWDIMTKSELMKSLPNDTKVVCEVFYNPMGEMTDSGIKFVNTSYDPKKLGTLLTVIPLEVLQSSNGNTHPNSDDIIDTLISLSNNDIRVLSNKLQVAKTIDISSVIDPIMSMNDDMVRVLVSRKASDAEAKNNLKTIVQSVKDSLAEYILDHEDILDKFMLGPEIEGLVLYLNGHMYKITTPEFKKKMKDAKNLKEQKGSDTVVMAFGRFQPPTAGHGVLIDTVLDLAMKHGAEHIIFVSRTIDAKNNPLTAERKVYFLKKMYPNANFIATPPHIKNVPNAIVSISKKYGGYKNLVMVAGDDRKKGYEDLIGKFNADGALYDHATVVTGPRSKGISGSDMRKAAKAGDFKAFSAGMPKHMNAQDIKQLYFDVRDGLGMSHIDNNLIPEERDPIGSMSNKEALNLLKILVGVMGVDDPSLSPSEMVNKALSIASTSTDSATTDVVGDIIRIANKIKIKYNKALIQGGKMASKGFYNSLKEELIARMMSGMIVEGEKKDDKDKLSAKELFKSIYTIDPYHLHLYDGDDDGDGVDDPEGDEDGDEDDGDDDLNEGIVSDLINMGIDIKKIIKKSKKSGKTTKAKVEEGVAGAVLGGLAAGKFLHPKYKSASSIAGGAALGSMAHDAISKRLEMRELRRQAEIARLKRQITNEDLDLDEDYDAVEELSESSSVEENLSPMQRRQLSMRMKRMAPQLARRRAMAMMRTSSSQRLKNRAHRMARNVLKLHLAKGRPWESLSPAERSSIETKLKGMGPVIARLERKLLKRVKEIERAHLTTRFSMKDEEGDNQ